MKAKIVWWKLLSELNMGKRIKTEYDIPPLTKKQREVLIAVHPYLEALTYKQAAEKLGISASAVRHRLKGIYKRVPWLQKDIWEKRKAENAKKESLRRPSRFSDMWMIGDDGVYDTYHGERILRKF